MHFTKGFTSVYQVRWRKSCENAMKLRGIIKNIYLFIGGTVAKEQYQKGFLKEL